MSQTDRRMTLIQEQLNSKILWDAPDYEVIEWLEQKHSISGPAADSMLSIAKKARVRVIREKALYGVIFSGIGTILTGGIVFIQIYGGLVFVLRTIVMIAVFGFCLSWFARYMSRLITGHTDSSAGL